MRNAEAIEIFQSWINSHGFSIAVDGIAGKETASTTLKLFTNLEAPAVTDDDLKYFANELQCSPDQIKAFTIVESAGGGFTNDGKPKILYERHKFWQITDGQYPKSIFNDPKWGGYKENSWSKLIAAIAVDPIAAFQSCSWGKFQIMGFHAERLGYPNVFAMSHNMVLSEADHYEAFVRFIKAEKLENAVRAISENPRTNRIIALRYNGEAALTQNHYDQKLADAMRRIRVGKG